MDKEQMQQAIIMADKKGQKIKRSRMISYMVLSSVCSFAFLRTFFPKELWEDLLGAVILGAFLGFVIPMAIVFYCSMADIQISYPEDRDLAERLRIYRERFGEDFYGPWSR